MKIKSGVWYWLAMACFVVGLLYGMGIEGGAQLGQPVPPIDPWLEHILVTAMMKGYFEIVLHDMPPAAAQRYLEELNDFFTAGWARIMGQA